MITAVVALAACTKDPEVSIDKAMLDMGYRGGECDFTVTSSCDWTLICSSDDEDLVTISETSGTVGTKTIHVSISENESKSILSHYFTAVAHGAERDALETFTIVQGARGYVMFNKNVFTSDYIGGEYTFIVSSNFPWAISTVGEGITVSPTSGAPRTAETKADGDDDSDDDSDDDEDEDLDPNSTKITVTIDEYEGDVNREFMLSVTAITDEGKVNDKLTITQTRPLLMIGNREYPIKKMADGRWWMVSNLCFVQKGVTIGDSFAGIWYPCSDTAREFDTTDEGIVNKGLLYADYTAFSANITATTCKKMEGVQGICPDGWHLPTYKEYMALVGKSETETNPDAPYYDADKDCGSIAKLEADGFNPNLAGYLEGDGKKFANNGEIRGYVSRYRSINTSYIYSSNAESDQYEQNWFVLSLNRNNGTANIEKQPCSTMDFPVACSVRCIKNKE